MNWTDLIELRELLPNCLRHERMSLEARIAGYLRGQRFPDPPPEQVGRWLEEARRSIRQRHLRHERLPQVSYPSSLPITARKSDIVSAIRSHQVIVIAGETGSGKTTQIPKMCLEAGLGVEGKIGCTQPRRVAALSISRRIAQELNVEWGREVGCKIRFSDRSSPGTYIKLMTDGILLAETQGDPELNEYDAIVIDEAHERSLNIDFLLGHLKGLLGRRPELKLIITSATIDTEAFAKAFDNAPILEVSGRTYPVEIRYAPYDAEAEECGDLTYIDAAVNAVEMALLESDQGDVLVFMPSERDIRETQDDLQGHFGGEAEIVPLFGRLTSGEQDRVFAPSTRRKVIVATNIAETSLTLPGVRYVIDTGLARVSRYSPRTRTKRLPIEPVSQSSANQRAGRSGRVEKGVCIRLYSEEDFLARPKYTQPEIQRANLAEVILKMKAWRLGEMETFPFINPPQPQAIQSGYQLLQELGALDAERNLTSLGRDLARLPVDPAMGRMILQSAQEGVLVEVLIIAAGLSIQDPRERPLDKQEAADQAHRQFLDPNSDFISLLNIWNAYDAKLEALRTQNLMRRFCKTNFLSYTRMREWIDVHTQLEEAVRQMLPSEQRTDSVPGNGSQEVSDGKWRNPVGERNRSPQGAAQVPLGRGERMGVDRRNRPIPPLQDVRFKAIHRSILAGLLGHIAQRVERNIYRASANRQMMVWPGSSLFDRNPGSGNRARTPVPKEGGAERKTCQPEWVVAGEIVETTRLFGRNLAGVAPEWISDLGAHICKRTYGSPFWDPRAGRVLVRERISLFGLEIEERTIDYGRLNPAGATEVFIRSALVEDDIESPHRFLEHNRQLRQKIEVWRTHLRDHRLPNTADALFEFYQRNLEAVSSVHDLNRVLRERVKQDANFLCANETDLTGGQAVLWDTAAFPNTVLLGEQSAALNYAYAPGEEHDGITVKVPVALAHRIDARLLDLVVPGLRQEQIEFLLKSLPKAVRVALMPIAPKVIELSAALRPEAGLEGLRQLVQERYGVAIPADAWKREVLPDHLRPRVAITGQKDQVVAAGRDLGVLQRDLAQHESHGEKEAWSQAVQQWERYDLRTWSFGDLPEQIEVTRVAGSSLSAFPGLEADSEDRVHLKLFRNRSEAEATTRAGFFRLAEFGLAKELAWLQKDLRSFEKTKELYGGLTSLDDLVSMSLANIRRRLIGVPEAVLPLRQAQFDAAIAQARLQVPVLMPKFVEGVMNCLRLRQDILKHRAFGAVPAAARTAVITDLRQLGASAAGSNGKGASPLRAELDRLMPPDFLARVPFDRLQHLPRYLKALLVRADRALLNPAKDLERSKQIQPYTDALRELDGRRGMAPAAQRSLEEYRWLIEEFRVSVFAQELGTVERVSPKRLDSLLNGIRAGGGTSVARQ